METQKTINLQNDSSNYPSKFAKKKWHVIDGKRKGKYIKKKKTPTNL